MQGRRLHRVHRLRLGMSGQRHHHGPRPRGIPPPRRLRGVYPLPQVRRGLPRPASPAPAPRPRPAPGGPRRLVRRGGRAHGELLRRVLLRSGPGHPGPGAGWSLAPPWSTGAPCGTSPPAPGRPLSPLRGSKYAQSDLGDTFRQVKTLLENGTEVLFSGLACQVDGLNRFLGRDYPNLLTVDLVCHGGPLSGGAAGLCGGSGAAAGQAGDPPALPGQGQGLENRPPDGRLRRRLPVDRGPLPHHLRPGVRHGAVPAALLRPVPVRQSGPAGRLHPGRLLGDWTPSWRCPPTGRRGISLVLLHSGKAQQRFAALSGSFGEAVRPVDEAVAGNPRLASPSAPSPKRAAFFAALRAEGYPAAQKAFLTPPPLPTGRPPGSSPPR